jgi:hypothetical protein
VCGVSVCARRESVRDRGSVDVWVDTQGSGFRLIHSAVNLARMLPTLDLSWE